MLMVTRRGNVLGGGRPWLAGLVALAMSACSGPIEEGSAGGTSSDSDSDSGSSSSADGSGSGSAGSTGDGSSGGASGSSDPGGSGSSGGDGTSTSAGGMDCAGLEELRLGPDDAARVGPWELGYSNFLDQPFLLWDGPFENPPNNALRFNPQIPCDDEWHVWALMFDEARYDSFFVQSDGAPADPAIFDGDCDQNNEGRWIWSELNWRVNDPYVGPCDFTEDPWVQKWSAGEHELEFSFRESYGLAEVIITNDPSFSP